VEGLSCIVAAQWADRQVSNTVGTSVCRRRWVVVVIWWDARCEIDRACDHRQIETAGELDDKLLAERVERDRSSLERASKRRMNESTSDERTIYAVPHSMLRVGD
jgi:hypothetical protein